VDPLTLRVALAAVAVSLLLLSYAGVHRRIRSQYSMWWCLSLVAAAASTVLYLLNGTSAQVIANPAANVVGVLGTACTWGAARALRGRPLGAWPLVVPATGVLLASMAEGPSTNVWAGGWALLAGMALLFAVSARELWQLRAEHRAMGESPWGTRAITMLAVTVTGLGLLYGFRFAMYVVLGPDHAAFQTYAGTVPTTMALIVALVIVTFTMTDLSAVERTHHLRMRATRDSLTGLLNRGEFEARATARLASSGARHAIVFADLDHFKAINDTHGHAAGDAALATFASACQQTLTGDEIVGRMGGEEFALLLPTAEPEEARARVERVSEAYARLAKAASIPSTTVSYGIAIVAETDDLAQALRRADAAMYRAKRAGRDQAVVDGTH
jgi:diguanylate cyclase (GGDEF)-like protein